MSARAAPLLRTAVTMLAVALTAALADPAVRIGRAADSKSIEVRGVVLKPDGQPAVGAVVRAALPLSAALEPILGSDFKPPAWETKADSRGEFSISIPAQPVGDLSHLDEQLANRLDIHESRGNPRSSRRGLDGVG